jgi:hypothetical protein
MVAADSPLACIRWATAALVLSSAFGRPMDCPRARRASRAAARRSPAQRLTTLVVLRTRAQVFVHWIPEAYWLNAQSSRLYPR